MCSSGKEIHMKKISFKFVLLQIAVILLLGILTGVIFCICNGELEVDTVIAGSLLFSALFATIYAALNRHITGYLVKKTFEKNIQQYDFVNGSIFYGINATIKIDQQRGKIAFVSNQNPFEFQVISAREIDNIKSDYFKGPLGGTRYVYFAFSYHNRIVRIATFTAGQMHSMRSARVIEGIAKADTFAGILQNARNLAM